MNTQKAPFKWVSTATGILSYFTRNTQKGNERLTCVCCLEQLRAGDVATGGGNLGWNLGWYRAAAGAHRHCRGFLYSRQQESHTVRMAGGSVRARAPPPRWRPRPRPGKRRGLDAIDLWRIDCPAVVETIENDVTWETFQWAKLLPKSHLLYFLIATLTDFLFF